MLLELYLFYTSVLAITGFLAQIFRIMAAYAAGSEATLNMLWLSITSAPFFVPVAFFAILILLEFLCKLPDMLAYGFQWEKDVQRGREKLFATYDDILLQEGYSPSNDFGIKIDMTGKLSFWRRNDCMHPSLDPQSLEKLKFAASHYIDQLMNRRPDTFREKILPCESLQQRWIDINSRNLHKLPEEFRGIIDRIVKDAICDEFNGIRGARIIRTIHKGCWDVIFLDDDAGAEWTAKVRAAYRDTLSERVQDAWKEYLAQQPTSSRDILARQFNLSHLVKF